MPKLLYVVELCAVVQENVAQYREIVAELERLLPQSSAGHSKRKQPSELDNIAGELTNTINNTHDLLYHVAAKMDALNERIDEAKRLHLEARRRVSHLVYSRGVTCHRM